jgi:DMSO/TMAO reductase YedYZ molybdopterin-dependent catalytic subunit
MNDANSHESSKGQSGSTWLEGKDRRLEWLSAAPLVLQTPLSLLAGTRITDKQFLFVRNCHDIGEGLTLEPRPLAGSAIELAGLISPAAVVIRAEDLAAMDQIEYEMVLQCAGNGRSRYGGVPGTPWEQGGVANVRFSGVPLSAVLEKHRVSIDSRARFVTATGGDVPVEPESPDFEHSLPLADVLARSILAVRLNGEPLPVVHGGPVRLVTPGLFGTMQVKWLTRLRFEAAESRSYFHATEYRVPHSPVEQGQTFSFTLENSRPTWVLRLISHVFDPLPGAQLKQGPVTVRGVAYNDGSVRVASVLVSFDRGNHWLTATLEAPESPYAWYRWTAQATLTPGVHEIWSRAVDAAGRTQPLDGSIDWNPNGYEWAGVFKTEVLVK